MNQKLIPIYILCLDIKNKPFQDQLYAVANYFLGTKYGPWEDGTELESLDDFNVDLETLDCVTFVEVVLALAKTAPAENIEQFEVDFMRLLAQLHYKNGVPNFVSRNHFQCLDWIENNKFCVEDITGVLIKAPSQAVAIIDKLSWLRLHKINQAQELELTSNLEKSFSVQKSQIAYIPTEYFLNSYALFKQSFPEYSIVNIVRPNWDLTEQIGTHLNISHLGFVFKDSKSQDLMFYHASSNPKKVVNELLFTYMERCKDSPTIRGINVLAISPGSYRAR